MQLVIKKGTIVNKKVSWVTNIPCTPCSDYDLALATARAFRLAQEASEGEAYGLFLDEPTSEVSYALAVFLRRGNDGVLTLLLEEDDIGVLHDH